MFLSLSCRELIATFWYLVGVLCKRDKNWQIKNYINPEFPAVFYLEKWVTITVMS